ncbi:hypothetical protein T08_3957 [Trichinella sp. T8]|nr:hypothetical protein T08_3957 [Trichinella sp. T8]
MHFKLHLNLVTRNFYRPKSYAHNEVRLYFI